MINNKLNILPYTTEHGKFILSCQMNHKILEHDKEYINIQGDAKNLLQDKLATEQMQQDSMSKYGMNPYSSTLNAPVLDGGLDEESSEALVICLAIAGLTLVPQLLGN